MKICVAGLGIIGGSMCLSLKRAGYAVYGWNRSPQPVQYSLKNKIIDGCAENLKEYDIVFVALPPEAAVKFINGNEFKSGAVVTDICGVKQYIKNEVYKKQRTFHYIGCHPMAGKEVSGIENACADLFDRASMVITFDGATNERALECIRTLTKDMGFKYIVECSAEVHDKKIAYTSQLAHIVSNAYVKDEQIDGCIGFTGGSFQDMTRIAGVDEEVWSSLYLLNSGNLINNINCLISSLTEIKAGIESGNREKLKDILRNGRLRFESGKNIAERNDIVVRKLK